eukprot:1187810-Prorocentrum_minimum.AAC.8
MSGVRPCFQGGTRVQHRGGREGIAGHPDVHVVVQICPADVLCVDVQMCVCSPDVIQMCML